MILHRYFAWRFFLVFSAVFMIFLGIFILLDMVEQIRKFDSDNVGFFEIVKLTLLNVPQGIYRILPLIMILATLALFLSLARSSELVVTRSSGRSALRALIAPILVAFAIGVFAVAVFNPIVAATSKQYEIQAAKHSQDISSVLSISREGLWLRQGDSDGQTVIRAVQSNLDGTRLFDVTFMALGPDGAPRFRVSADIAQLGPDGWQLTNAKRWSFAGEANPEQSATTHASFQIASNLTTEQIRDSFGTPASIPIWELWGFINQLERAGFSARSHRVWLQMEMALPLMMVAMLLIGAAFTMRHTRFGRTGVLVLTALGLGFAMYFIRNFAQILGENGQIPIYLAAWSPPLAAICLSLGILLNVEDG
ncbi:Permease, YjgP/YjgQ family [Candidatus Rhodobacter oscarellae]|uniref:Permease, YjgP/YjgQ family n=1 Tax=Candidatus Rhodobacter oscarellae TaxID=1675527 RepID=A0A0J9GRX6_9RHOB|nr:LPS export ABC transporter permease LptG [Candidatus Rhodobacter lobularis]KMW56233.1 Permease, YjgP/YjgQ family [Candidatus Rhodobacter lobularis]